MPTEVTLPSGLKGMIREFGILEENLMSDPRHARSGRNLHRAFKECWLETIDAGIYDFGEQGFVPNKLLQGDGVVLLVLLRIESYGPEYFFDINCPICGTLIPWELDLNEYLEDNIQKLPEESKRVIKEENGIFKGKFPRCGKEFSFRLLTLRDELKFPEIRQRSSDRLSSVLLNNMISKIEGVDHKNFFLGVDPYPEGWKGTFETLSSFDANHFRQDSDEVSCGLETSFTVECPMHGEVKVELPFREGFMLPKRRRR